MTKKKGAIEHMQVKTEKKVDTSKSRLSQEEKEKEKEKKEYAQKPTSFFLRDSDVTAQQYISHFLHIICLGVECDETFPRTNLQECTLRVNCVPGDSKQEKAKIEK